MGCLGVFKEQNRKEELDFYLRLFDFEAHATVIAVDAAGEPIEDGYLLHINKTNGSVLMYKDINPTIGFDLTADGELTLDN